MENILEAVVTNSKRNAKQNRYVDIISLPSSVPHQRQNYRSRETGVYTHHLVVDFSHFRHLKI